MTMIETAKAPQAQSHSGLLLDVKDLRVTFKNAGWRCHRRQ